MDVDQDGRHASDKRVPRVFVVAAILCWLGALTWLASPLVATEPDAARILPTVFVPPWALMSNELETKLDYAVQLGSFMALLLVAQWMFLRPRGTFRTPTGNKPRSMSSAILAGAFIAMLLTVGAVATVHEIVSERELLGEHPISGLIVVGTTAVWVAWFVAFFMYTRGDPHSNALRKMLRPLIAGSFLEFVVALGVFAWNPNDDDCWCARGSYTGLIMAATVMIWAFGPGLVLLFRYQARQRVSRAPRGIA